MNAIVEGKEYRSLPSVYDLIFIRDCHRCAKTRGALRTRFVPSEVKRIRYEQDEAHADFSQGAYKDVRDQEKT